MQEEKGKGASVQIHVNEQPVIMVDHKATGLQIKETAVAQGVRIQADFVLSQELTNGKVKIVGDTDEVTLNRTRIRDGGRLHRR